MDTLKLRRSGPSKTNFECSHKRETDIGKQIKTVKYKESTNGHALKLVLQWVATNKCLILSQNNQEITFIQEGITYFVHVKQTRNIPTSSLTDRQNLYASYGVKTLIVFNFYEFVEFMENKQKERKNL